MNKKKKSTNISPYPDEAIERLARAFYPAIFACWNSEEGQREFAAWQEEQAHIATKEKQEVPDSGVVRIFRSDMLERCHTVHPELSRCGAEMQSGLQVRQGVSPAVVRCLRRRS